MKWRDTTHEMQLFVNMKQYFFYTVRSELQNGFLSSNLTFKENHQCLKLKGLKLVFTKALVSFFFFSQLNPQVT